MPAPGAPRYNVWLIGGPADGCRIALRRPLDWIDVAGARYVVVPTYALDAPEPIGYVGILLTLYADLWLRRQARRRSPREDQDP